ncbi:MAG: hypothetical protein P794_06855 [Epsilonproteobacteria bacterium (ex Lamellibrachia satsuma)]|nr:MAG: hypothetical protein P794_06855 [Epsilonproteobacteria bacterium (ex Lamellibrachia satsuma)]
MDILLINTNPVVSRLIALCTREDNMNLEETDNIANVSMDKYNIVFVDEASYGDETQNVLSNLIVGEKVFLSSHDETSDEIEFFDTIIKKPFLPSQIINVLEDAGNSEKEEAVTEMPSIFPLSADAEETIDEIPEEETKVLDLNEIGRIKELLDMEEEEGEAVREEEYESRKIEVIKQQLIADGLEIVDEDEYIETLRKKDKKKKNNSVKKKKEQKKKKDNVAFEEALLAAVKGMKVKKIKKLLRGAEVTIKIHFKEER